MKIKFDSNQDFQLDAIRSVVDVFAGQPLTRSSLEWQTDVFGGELLTEMGVGNSLLAASSPFGDWQRCGASRRGRRLAAPGAGALPIFYCIVPPKRTRSRAARARPSTNDKCDGRGLAHDAALPASGRLIRNVAPGPWFGSAHNRPPCASMIEREMVKPMPIPWR